MAVRRKRVQFKLAGVAEAEKVFLCGTFNEWDTSSAPLKRGRNGEWKTSVLLHPGRYEYRFLVDGEWVDDPDAETVANPLGTANCVIDVG